MILDIELQFVERDVPAPEFGEDIYKTVHILQSRKLVRGYWSEWSDVPLAPQVGAAKVEAKP